MRTNKQDIRRNGGYRWQGQAAWKSVLPVLLLCFSFMFPLTGCGEEPLLTVKGGVGAPAGAVETGEENGEEHPEEIYVHVCGAVVDPGLKCLEKGSRAWQALEAAGGFTQEADISAVNLAKEVQDGEQLYFSAKEEAGDRQAEGGEGRINLNTADEEKLCSLPGIGSTRAKAILKYRKEQGGFREIGELMEVPGIKEAIYDQICDLVYVP